MPDDILKLAGYCRYLSNADIARALTEAFVDKAVGGVGYVEDHQDPVEYLQRDQNGIGKYGAVTVTDQTAV